MSLPVVFCLTPCNRYFDNDRALQVHRTKSRDCMIRWHEQLLQESRRRNLAAPVPMVIDNEEAQYSAVGNAMFDEGSPPTPEEAAPARNDSPLHQDYNATGSEQRPNASGSEQQQQQQDDNRPQGANPPIYTYQEERYMGAATVLHTTTSPFQELYRRQVSVGAGNLYYPFAGHTDWDFARWLHNSGLPRKKIDEFIQLRYVKQCQLSFQSANSLVDRIEQLPNPGTTWRSLRVVPESGIPIEEVTLFYRDALDAIQSLLCRPAFKDSMEFVPRKIWKMRDDVIQERIYNELFTGDWAWRAQESLPIGGALIPVILASDKTHLTVLAGNKQAWPLYLSIGNIYSSVRNKPSRHAWVLIAYLPIAAFELHLGEDLSGVFKDRLFHQCLKVVLHTLVEAGNNGVPMSDWDGHVRLAFPRLAAYLLDYPEQCLVNIASQYSSPVTTATFHDLGNSVPNPRRTQAWILSQIEKVKHRTDPMNFKQYKQISREFGLNAVHEPFWVDLPGYEPDLAVCPDILHGIHRFWRDHILQWVFNVVGRHEITRRLRLLQPIVGIRHFSNGIPSLKQWTGREDRELQRYFIAILHEAPNLDEAALMCLRSFHDLLYLVQYRNQSTNTIAQLSQALWRFHSLKGVFLDNGGREPVRGQYHFKIPKIAGLHLYQAHIIEMGSSLQYSTEISETLHKSMAKDPYRSTNHRDHEPQMCRKLDRSDKVAFMDEFLAWARGEAQRRTQLASLLGAPLFNPGDEVPARQPQERVAGQVILTKVPHFSDIMLGRACVQYQIPPAALASALTIFSQDAPPAGVLYNQRIDIWKRIRIVTPGFQDDDGPVQLQTAQALPPTVQMPRGRGDCVLIRFSEREGNAGVQGYRVAQLRMIFRLKISSGHPLHLVPLALVDWFSEPLDRAEQPVNMFRFTRLTNAAGHPFRAIIKLDNVSRLAQLVPQFPRNTTALTGVTPEDMMENSRWFLLNCYRTKECFHELQ